MPESPHASDGRHIPVLLDEVIAALQPEKGQRIIDGTFGAGGYTRRILETGAFVTAVDRDPSAIEVGRAMENEFAGRLTLVQGTFSTLDQVALLGAPDGIVLDIGVSSMQIDEAERGFSFQKDGPLDMRMSSSGPSAADVVNRLKIGDLARIFNFLGEERHAGRIARMIDKRRTTEPFTRTRDLANAIEALVGRNPKVPIHPATRVFQALRIFVNDELGELVRALHAAERVLKPGGRLVVVTFHSLEDRIVKRFFSDRSGAGGGSRHLPQRDQRLASFTPVGKGVVIPAEDEALRNPRARSAKLRAGTRTVNPALAEDHAIYGLPNLPVFIETARN
ncbi:16S rRNA (cytosine(1402)-N(4))-methyltransferase RsmH [Phyllobacterium endophyticum]|uniref:16S rRNA (cytosine(1402)-N(4))-methyltransferase RsmH n=1 Tax=Phyllobacterium endophyticum TaxID=1149773 RepID=UPI0011CAAA9D|nr:16S rRNA (cytosine(1402)-N(4))-methyltransferase RsmH [Phyllobacterium endophyticum]TXR47760.1 16S rRNA (cytosine(1402)-N(4))-methyltransferase RsmH [Phyllobacterium endophyticum]